MDFLSYGPLDNRNQPTRPNGADFALEICIETE